MISVFAVERRLSLFSLHPVFMSAGCLVFIAEGIVAYRNSALLEVLSPIMQHNKKAKVRAIHQGLQITGTAFIFIGLLFILLHKFKAAKSLVPSSIHAVAGTVVLVLICIQGITGLQKVHQIEVNNKRVRRWHGASGLLAWDLLCFTCCAGVVGFVPFAVAKLILCCSISLLWLSVHTQVDSRGLGRSSALRSESPSALDSDSAQDLEADDDAVGAALREEQFSSTCGSANSDPAASSGSPDGRKNCSI